MSDHWNLLADLLGTPNLGNRSKKTTKTESTDSPPAGVDSADKTPSEQKKSDQQPVVFGGQPPTSRIQDEHQQAKSEPHKERSMIQSSWDALANLFGIADNASIQAPIDVKSPSVSQEPQDTVERPASRGAQPSREPTKGGSTQARSKSKRSTTSMWETPAVESVDRQDFTAEKTPQADASALPSFSNPSPSPQSERRGPRHSPRRGRMEHPDHSLPPSDSSANPSISPSLESSPSPSEAPSDRRSSRHSDRDRAASGDDTRRGSSQERDRRSTTRDGQTNDQERSDRRTSGSRESRSAEPRERSSRETREVRDRQGRSPRPSKTAEIDPLTKRSSSGFAAGVSDEFIDADAPEFGSEISPNPRTHDDDSGPTIRRKKRRGRTREQTNAEADEFSDASDADRSGESSDSRPRHGKIPTWTETIGFVIQANVINHQKQSASGRGRPRRPNR